MSAPAELPRNDSVAGSSHAERLCALFAGAETHHGTYDPGRAKKSAKGKVEIKSAAWTIDTGGATSDLWHEHLGGERMLGVVPIREDGTCVWGAIDVDDHQIDLEGARKQIEAASLPLVLCRSKSGGAHLYLFLDQPASAADVQGTLRRIAAGLGWPGAEVFPKQTAIDPQNGRRGNWLNMPYAGGDQTNRYCVKPGGLEMSVAEFLSHAEKLRVAPADLARLAVPRPAPLPSISGGPLASAEDARRKLEQLADRLANALPHDANSTLTAVAYDLGRYCRDSGLPEAEAREAMREAWVMRKPDPSDMPEFEQLWRRQFDVGVKNGKPATDRPTESATIVRLSDVVPRPVTWLWPSRFAIGKLSIIAGPPGVGKSQIATWIAACVSTGGAWPFGEGRAPLGTTVVLSAEDDPADTFRPRLEAAGGDPSRVLCLGAIERSDGSSRGFDLSADLAMLRGVLDDEPDVRLVIVDPISAYLGNADSHRNAEVRGVLAPLAALAAERGVAVICISHLTKAPQSAINSITGSGAFVAAARSAWLVTKETEPNDEGDQIETGRRLMTVVKNNLGPDGASRALAYEVVEMLPEYDGLEIPAPAIRWVAQVQMTADEALHPGVRGSARPIEKAKAFLKTMLGSGPTRQSEVKRMADESGITDGTLRNAKSALGIESTKSGEGGAWVWSLPGQQAELPMTDDAPI